VAVNCISCRYYQTSIRAKCKRDNTDGQLPCLICADLKDRKSFYEPINTPRKYKRGGQWYPTRPGR